MTLLAQITFAVAFVVLLAYVLLRLVRFARKGGSGLQALGAALMIFGFGSVRDPVDDITEQSDQVKRKEEDGGENSSSA
jgi:hypothetical protein